MRIFSLIHLTLMTIVLSGIGYCSRDAFEGADARLLVKEHGAPDSKYGSEVTVYLSGNKGATVVVDVNTTHYWYIDNASFYSVPNWCEVSTPSAAINGIVAAAVTGQVTDKTITFINKADNEHPFAQAFDLILRNNANPTVFVTIHVIRNMMGQEFDVIDYQTGTCIAKYKAAKVAEAMPPYPTAYINVAGAGEDLAFVVKSPMAWTFTITPTGVNASEAVGDWITAGIDGGIAAAADGININFATDQTGDVVVLLSIDANASNRYPRTAEIEIKMVGGDYNINSIKIPIRQSTADAYLYLEDGLLRLAGELAFDYKNPDEYSGADFSKTFTSISNRRWDATITPVPPTTDVSWVSISPTSGSLDPFSGLTDPNVTITVSPNPDFTERFAMITFVGEYDLLGVPISDLVYELTVVQAAKVLEFSTSTSSLTFAPSVSGNVVGSYQTFTITSNDPWTLTKTFSSGGEDFVIVGATSASHDDRFVTTTIRIYPATPNDSEIDSKVAIYTITCNGETKEITVTQTPKLPRWTLNQFAGTLAKAQNYTVPVAFDDWEFSVDWLSVTQSGPGILSIRPTTNNEEHNGGGPYYDGITRSAIVLVKNGGVPVGEIVVEQDRLWWLGVSNVSWFVSSGDPKPPIPNLDFMEWTNNGTYRRGIYEHIFGTPPASSLSSVTDQSPPPYPQIGTWSVLGIQAGTFGSITYTNPETIPVVTLNYSGSGGGKRSQIVTLKGWIGGSAIPAQLTRPVTPSGISNAVTTNYSSNAGLFYQLTYNILTAPYGNVDVYKVNSNDQQSPTSTIEVEIEPSSNTNGIKRFFHVYFDANTTLSDFRFNIYFMQIW